MHRPATDRSCEPVFGGGERRSARGGGCSDPVGTGRSACGTTTTAGQRSGCSRHLVAQIRHRSGPTHRRLARPNRAEARTTGSRAPCGATADRDDVAVGTLVDGRPPARWGSRTNSAAAADASALEVIGDGQQPRRVSESDRIVVSRRRRVSPQRLPRLGQAAALASAPRAVGRWACASPLFASLTATLLAACAVPPAHRFTDVVAVKPEPRRPCRRGAGVGRARAGAAARLGGLVVVAAGADPRDGAPVILTSDDFHPIEFALDRPGGADAAPAVRAVVEPRQPCDRRRADGDDRPRAGTRLLRRARRHGGAAGAGLLIDLAGRRGYAPP